MFSRIGNFLYHSSVNKNSISYINKQNENITLDPSGTDYVEYSTDSDYFTEAHSLIPNSETQVTTTALKLQDSSTPANNFFFSSLAVSSLGDFTLCVKHKLNAPSTSTDIISHYFTSPQYDITLSVPYVSETIPFNVFVSKASDGPLDYEVSGNLTIADLTNGDISGTLSTVESVLPYTLNAGTSGKDFVFLLNDLDISLNTPIYTQYTVTVTFVDSSPAFSLNGVSKQSIRFTGTGGVSYVFDQSDSTNAGYRIVFGEAKDSTPYYTNGVTEVGTPGQSGAYTKIEYSGSTELYYFNDGTADMGNTPPVWAEKKRVTDVNSESISIATDRICYSRTGYKFYDKNLNTPPLFTRDESSNQKYSLVSKNGLYAILTFATSNSVHYLNISNLDNVVTKHTFSGSLGKERRYFGITNNGSIVIYRNQGSGAYILFNGGVINDTVFDNTAGSLTAMNISGNGNVIAIVQNTTNQLNLYTVSGTTVTKLSTTLTLKHYYNIYSINGDIKISDNGQVMAFPVLGPSYAYALIYKWDGINTNSFTLIGEFLKTLKGGIELSYDGTHVVIGGDDNTPGKLSIYKYSGSGTTWTNVGSSIQYSVTGSEDVWGYLDDDKTTLYTYVQNGHINIKYILE